MAPTATENRWRKGARWATHQEARWATHQGGGSMILARLRRMSIVTRILAVATLSLVVLSGTLFAVVKQTVETTTFDQTRAEVIHADGMLHYLADQKDPPAIVDGKLVFRNCAR